MFVKCFFDRGMALFGLLVCSPIFLIVSMLIKIKMPEGPVIFKQKRVGKDGKLFTMYKFRTMAMEHGGSSISVAGELCCASISWMSCPNYGMYWLAI